MQYQGRDLLSGSAGITTQRYTVPFTDDTILLLGGTASCGRVGRWRRRRHDDGCDKSEGDLIAQVLDIRV